MLQVRPRGVTFIGRLWCHRVMNYRRGTPTSSVIVSLDVGRHNGHALWAFIVRGRERAAHSVIVLAGEANY